MLYRAPLWEASVVVEVGILPMVWDTARIFPGNGSWLNLMTFCISISSSLANTPSADIFTFPRSLYSVHTGIVNLAAHRVFYLPPNFDVWKRSHARYVCAHRNPLASVPQECVFAMMYSYWVPRLYLSLQQSISVQQQNWLRWLHDAPDLTDEEFPEPHLPFQGDHANGFGIDNTLCNPSQHRTCHTRVSCAYDNKQVTCLAMTYYVTAVSGN